MEFILEGIMSVTWQQIVMYLIGILLIWLAIHKEYEPSLLLPMGFGAMPMYFLSRHASQISDSALPGVKSPNHIRKKDLYCT